MQPRWKHFPAKFETFVNIFFEGSSGGSEGIAGRPLMRRSVVLSPVPSVGMQKRPWARDFETLKLHLMCHLCVFDKWK